MALGGLSEHGAWGPLNKYLINELTRLLQPIALHMRTTLVLADVTGPQSEFLNIMEVPRLFRKDFCESVLLTTVRMKRKCHEAL